MKNSESKSCITMALILEKVSYLWAVVLFTFPFLILMYIYNKGIDSLNIYIFIEVFLGILLFFQCWHAFIDAKLFRLFVEDEVSMQELDHYLVKIFYRKWLKDKTLEYRIEASIRLLKRLFITLILHTVFFLIWLFAFLNNYGSVYLF